MTHKNYILTKILLLGIFFNCSSLKAQNKNKENDFSLAFNPQIFSLSKKKENVFDAPSATYVLSYEDIRRSGANSIPEALRLIPGLQVAKIDGNKWAISARGFDRQFSNKLLVMIDGRTVYTPLFSGVFWDIQGYILDDIEKIEVIRGPGGTIWGANAVNGIINIITKGAAQTQGFYLSQTFGGISDSITEVRYGGQTNDKDHYRIYAKKSHFDSETELGTNNESYTSNIQNKAGFRYDIASIKDQTINIKGDAFFGEAGNYFKTLPNPEKNDKESKGGNLNIYWNNKISEKSNFTLQTYYDFDEFKIPVLSRKAHTLDVDFQHFYNFNQDNQFAWGLGYRQILDDIKEGSFNNYIPLDYYPNKTNLEIFSAFLQNKFALLPDKLYLTVGSKFEKNDFTGFEYQPNARIAYYPKNNQTLWASISRAVRTPTRGEDGLDIRRYNGTTNPVVQRGSVNFNAEELLAYEIGYRIKPTTKTLIDATAFYNKYSSLRTFDMKSGVPTAENNGNGISYGFEILGKYQINNDWRVEASYDFIEMDIDLNTISSDHLTGKDLQSTENQTPRNQFKLRSLLNIGPKLEFDNILYYVDSLPSTSTRTPNGVPSYVRFDTRLGYFVNNSLDISFGIQNLFDDRHIEFKEGTFNTPNEIGRNIYVKITWQYF